MSRSGFSIRKLINSPHRSPGSDDSNDMAFECSSAKSIRVQYELEQYQIQQIQKAGRHPLRHQSSWVHSHSSPKKTSQKRIPRPITIVRHTNGSVRVQGGSTGRRNSTPHAASSPSLAGRISPAAPLSARVLGAAPCPFCGGDRGQQQQRHHHCRHLDVPHAASSILTPSQSRQLAASLPSDWVSAVSTPSTAPLMKTPSQDASMWLPSPDQRSAGRGLRSSQTATILHTQNVKARTPTITRTSADATIDPRSGSEIGANGPSPHPSTFVNGVPSPPLDPQDIYSGPMGGRNGSLREIPSDSSLSSASEGSWFLSEPDGGECAVTDSVQQLIRETDEAFRAVNSALDEAKRASRSPTPPTESNDASGNLQRASKALHTYRASQMHPLRTTPIAARQEAVPASAQNQLMSPMSPTSGAGRGAVVSPRKGIKSPGPLSPSPQILRTPTRGSSVHKPKRGSKSPKSKTQRAASYDSSAASRKSATSSPPLKGGSLNRHQHSYHRSLSRLNLAADKVTDRLFEGRTGRFGFHKIEADEVITPDQIQEFRKTRLAKAEAEARAEEAREARRQISSETLRSRSASTSTQGTSEATDTDASSVESPYAKNMPSRIVSSSANAGALSPAADLATPRASEFNRDVMTQAPTVSGPSSTSDEIIRTGQNLLATPPPTPPQLPSTTFASPLAPRAASTGDEESTTHPSGAVPPTRSSRRPSHTRGNSSLSHVPPLPTIPEVRITAPQPSDSSRQPQHEGQNATEEYEDQSATPKARTGAIFEDDGEHIFFTSTPCTATKPGFQHGRIRLAKADLVNTGTINSLESKLMTSPDETMDWIAFQMAILGGAGDLFSDPNDFLSRDAQEELADDLCDWFEDLGFSNSMLGSLVKREQPRARTLTSAAPLTPQTDSTGTPESMNSVFRERQGSGDSRSSSPESKASDEIPDSEVPETARQQVHNLPIPLVSEHPSGYWNQQPQEANRNTSDRGIKRWTLEGHPKRYQGPGIDVLKANTLPLRKSGQHLSPKAHPRTPKSGRMGSVRESMVSLPQSPMLDLVMTTAVDGSKEFVPMGYNLGHDLGDFLKWESEHVYASAFYGSD